MTESIAVLYLGAGIDELSSFRPRDDPGVVVLTTPSPDTAIAYVRSNRVDCVVIDNRLQDVQTASVLDDLSEVPTVLLTSEDTVSSSDGDDGPVVVPHSASSETQRDAVRRAIEMGDSDDGGTVSSTKIAGGESRSGRVLDASPVATLVVEHGRVLDANRRAKTLLELDDRDPPYPIDEFLNRLRSDSGNSLAPEEFPFQQLLSTGPSILGYEPTDSTGDGPQRWLLVDGEPLADAGSELVLTFSEVTWLKDHQRELEQRRIDLDAAVTELRRSNEELEQFAYVASHDLREPLRMVSNYLGLLERRYGDELDEDAQDFIEYAVEGAQRMRQFIDDLLQYSRVGRDDESVGAVELNDVVETVRTNLEVRLSEVDASVTVGDLPTVQGNDHRLQQLFQNLLSNAITHAGAEPPEIDIAAVDADEYCEIQVSDNGSGIEPGKQDRAFDLFYTTGEESTGIGLALCRKIVRNHGGEIWLDSTPGEGTTIHFTLIAADEDATTGTDD